MKVLWVTNNPIANHKDLLEISFSQSGGWVEAAYKSFNSIKSDIKLAIATVYKGNRLLIDEFDGNTFILVPSKYGISKYNHLEHYNKQNWQAVLDIVQPDLIHVWGSEFTHPLCLLSVANTTPSVVYVQGLIHQISAHYDAGMSFLEQLKSTTISDIIRKETYWNNQYKQNKRANIEREILRLSKNVIVESEWLGANCDIITGGCNIYFSKLPINQLFANFDWKINDVDRNTLFMPAPSSPIKGLNMMIKALAYVKKRCPNIKLIVPGNSSIFEEALVGGFKTRSYPAHIISLIKMNNLRENIVFIGKQTQHELAEYMRKCNLFIMPSAIENQSSTLIEAMMMGMPCISSNVGGIHDFLFHDVNGLLYRYNEPEVLAYYILELLNDDKRCQRLSKRAKESSRECRLSINVYNDFSTIYSNILKKKVKE